jgi:hypothetical protein
MNNLLNHIDLLCGLNMNPIPLEVSQSMTTTKWLMAMQAQINLMVDFSNGILKGNEAYTDAKMAILQAEYDALMVALNNGNIIPDGSIMPIKLNSAFFTTLEATITNYVHNATMFVSFGLDDNGHFIAYIPDTWNDIIFSTDIYGDLVLSLKEG